MRYAVHTPSLKSSAEPEIDEWRRLEKGRMRMKSGGSSSLNQGEGFVVFRGNCFQLQLSGNYI